MTEAAKPRVVFDTTTVFQATLQPYGPGETQALRLMDEDEIEVFVSNRLRAEYEQTLRRAVEVAQTTQNPKERQRLQNVTSEYVNAQLGRFDERASRLVNPPAYVTFERDPDDERVLNLAIHVDADFIVSKDRDLLDLGRNSSWREAYPNIRIVPPEELRKEISLWRERRGAAQEHPPDPELDGEEDL